MIRAVRSLRCAWLSGLFLAFSPAIAVAQGNSWTRVSAPDNSFSVETPCSQAELDKLSAVPDDVIPGVKIDSKHRVFCSTGSALFVAGVYEVDAMPDGDALLFDVISSEVRNDKTTEGSPSLTSIDEKRALLNRQEKDGTIAQTGFVELGPNSVVVLVSEVDSKGGFSSGQERSLIDRFSSSLKLNEAGQGSR